MARVGEGVTVPGLAERDLASHEFAQRVGEVLKAHEQEIFGTSWVVVMNPADWPDYTTVWGCRIERSNFVDLGTALVVDDADLYRRLRYATTALDAIVWAMAQPLKAEVVKA